MAGRAAHCAVERNSRIEVELAAQLIFAFRDRVRRGHVDFGREGLQSDRHFDGKRLVLDELRLGWRPQMPNGVGPRLASPPFTSSLTVSASCLVSIGRAGELTFVPPFCSACVSARRPCHPATPAVFGSRHSAARPRSALHRHSGTLQR